MDVVQREASSGQDPQVGVRTHMHVSTRADQGSVILSPATCVCICLRDCPGSDGGGGDVAIMRWSGVALVGVGGVAS